MIAMEKPAVNREIMLKRRIKDILSLGCSLTEVSNYSFVDENQLAKIGIDAGRHIRLLNPISSQLTLLRQNLAPNLLLSALKNQARNKQIKIFEIGSTFHPTPGPYPVDNSQQDFLPYQEERIGILLSGDETGFKLMAALKGIIDYLGEQLKVGLLYRESEDPQPWSDISAHAVIAAGKKEIGRIALLDNKTAKNLGLKKKTVIAEISFGEIFSLAEKVAVKAVEFEKYPPAVRDLAFVVDKKILYGDIIEEIRKHSKLIKQAELFDVYEGPKLGPKNKSLAFHIIYQADKTMTSDEVDGVQAGLVKKLEEKFGAKLRNF